MHDHAICGDGEAKYWLKPDIESDKSSFGLE